MRGHPAGFIARIGLVLGLLFAALSTVAPVAAAQPAPPLPKAYVLVDVDTGAVIAQQDARTLRPPASTIKLLTALIASQRLPSGDAVPISAVAEGMPARKINVKAGQVWAFEHLMYSMMMVSANDAAVALAEKIGGGSLDGYVTIANDTAARLGLADTPILNDPAGLDDEFSNTGGDRISPRDLAIVARAVLVIAVADVDHRHAATTSSPPATDCRTPHNHNLFLDLYAGSTGLKTGTTDLAGHTFVGSATRGGRSMMVVVFDAVDIVRVGRARCSTKASPRRCRRRRVSITCPPWSPTPRSTRRRRPRRPRPSPPATPKPATTDASTRLAGGSPCCWCSSPGCCRCAALRRPGVPPKGAAHDGHDGHRPPDRSARAGAQRADRSGQATRRPRPSRRVVGSPSSTSAGSRLSMWPMSPL